MPCPCGQSTVVLVTTTPDHAYLSAYNVHRHVEIRCASCSTKFVTDGLRLIRREDYLKRVAASQASREAFEKFHNSRALSDLREAFGAMLDELPSMAARHRFLTEHRLESLSLATFRKRWKGGSDWARHGIGSWSISKALGLLGRDPNQFAAELDQLKELEAAIPDAPTVMNCRDALKQQSAD